MSDKKYFSHYSVLNREVIDFFKGVNADGEKVFADFTFGAGGHSTAVVKEIADSRVVACDQDDEALANGKKILEESNLSDKVKLFKTNFLDFPSILQNEYGNEFKVDGIVIDLGVSSHHFDSAERGFSYRFDAPLDMRMDPSSGWPTAAEIINDLDEEDLANLIFKYGEERLSRRIARSIVERRKENPIETTKQLEEICFLSYPKNMRHAKPHPATRTFQALRIAVNRELEVIEKVLPLCVGILKPGGALCAISFHSLEDRIIKHYFKSLKAEKSCDLLTKKPILPSPDELNENLRSRSAKLRVVIKK